MNGGKNLLNNFTVFGTILRAFYVFSFHSHNSSKRLELPSFYRRRNLAILLCVLPGAELGFKLTSLWLQGRCSFWYPTASKISPDFDPDVLGREKRIQVNNLMDWLGGLAGLSGACLWDMPSVQSYKYLTKSWLVWSPGFHSLCCRSESMGQGKVVCLFVF